MSIISRFSKQKIKSANLRPHEKLFGGIIIRTPGALPNPKYLKDLGKNASKNDQTDFEIFRSTNKKKLRSTTSHRFQWNFPHHFLTFLPLCQLDLEGPSRLKKRFKSINCFFDFFDFGRKNFSTEKKIRALFFGVLGYFPDVWQGWGQILG